MKIKKIGISIILALALLLTAMPGFTSKAAQELIRVRINPTGAVEVGKEATFQVTLKNMAEAPYAAEVLDILVADGEDRTGTETGWEIIENDQVLVPEEHNGAATNKSELQPGDEIAFEIHGTVEKMIDASNQIKVIVGMNDEDKGWLFAGEGSYPLGSWDSIFEGALKPSETTVKRGEKVELEVEVTNTTEEDANDLSQNWFWYSSMMKGTWLDDVQPTLTWKKELTEGKLSIAAGETVEGTITVTIPENAIPSWFEFGVDVYSGTEEAGDLKTYFSGSARVNMEGGVLNPYPDVKTGNDGEAKDWFAEYALFMLDNGIMTGEADGTFSAGRAMHRDEFVTMLYRFDGEREVAYDPEAFSDVSDGEFYTKAIMWAKETGVVEGYADGRFGVGDSITREDLVKMLLGYAKHINFELPSEGDLNKFPDADSVSEYAVESMKWAIGNELITGDKGNINPQKYAERGHCAKIMTVFLQKYRGL